MWKWVVIIALVMFGVTSVSVGAEDAPPKQEDQQAQLRDALARIEALEKRVASLEGELAEARKAGPSRRVGQPAVKADEPGVWAKDTKLSGTITNSRGDRAATAVVVSSSKDRVLLRVTNEFGVRDWDVRVNGSAASLAGSRIVSSKFGNQLKDLKIAGTIDATSLKMGGTWTWQGPGGSAPENIRLELKVD
jgi:hypothetical protein